MINKRTPVQLVKGQRQLDLRVHHNGAAPRDGLVQRLTGIEDYAHARIGVRAQFNFVAFAKTAPPSWQ